MMQPCDDNDLPSFSDAVVADSQPPELEKTTSPAQASPATATTASKYQERTRVQTASGERDGDDSDDSDEFHDSESDNTAANYTLVKKSVFRDLKRAGGGGLLSRLKDAAPLRSSSTRNKYLPTTATLGSSAAVVAPRVRRANPRDAAPQIVIAETTGDSMSSDMARDHVPVSTPSDDVDDDPDSSGITVAIAESGSVNAESEDAQAAEDVVEVDVVEDDLPQVVIHSGESDSDSTGFATLNPVINASGGGSSSSRRYRSTTPLALTTPTSTTSTMVSASSTAATPCLQEIPAMLSVDGTAGASDHRRLTLVVNALGASGLAKVERFGTQSTFLEMRLCSVEATTPLGFEGAELLSGASVVRTALHKKGGSDAQWNQQFVLPLRSTDAQALHIAVKTHGKALVGEARVSLVNVIAGGLYYDQHYAIFRPTKPGDTDSSVDGRRTLDADAESGRVHLQLKVADASSSVLSIPPLSLSFAADDSGGGLHPQFAANEAVPLPPVLRNGALLFKVPYHTRNLGISAVRRQWVMVAAASTGGYEITWCDPTASANDRKRASSLALSLVTDVRDGHRTPVFERQLQTTSASSVVRDRDKCFSLVTNARSLDLVASCKEEARVWVSALRGLVFQRPDATDSLLSARVMENYKVAALSPRPVVASQPCNRSNVTSKARLAAWRSVVFDYARRCRTDEIAACLHDGCPIDLLEPGDGDTMLMIACRLGHEPLVALCLSWRAKNDPHPEFGETALQAAVNASHHACLALLLATAAKSDMDTEIVNHMDASNDAPLHVAARRGDFACLQLLLHHGADVCVVDEFGRTPLHCAAAHGHVACVAYLLDVGGDSVLNAGDHDGDTALHYAALAGDEAVVKLLLESAANVFSANAQNETPYDVALREKQQACAFLISQYYLTNTKESPVGGSYLSARNEPASTLLRRQQEEEEEEEEEEAERSEWCAGSDTSSVAYTRLHPPRYLEEYSQDGEKELDGYNRHQSPHYRTPLPGAAALASQTVLSPSDEVRKALLGMQAHWGSSDPSYHRRSTLDAYRHRNHHRHSFDSVPDLRVVTSRPAFYYSAQESSPSRPFYASAHSLRGAATERLDRESSHSYAYRQPYDVVDREFYPQVRQPTSSASTGDEIHYTRGYAAPDVWRQWGADRESHRESSYNGSNSLETTSAPDDTVARVGWANGSPLSRSDSGQHPTEVPPPPIAHVASSSSQWDMFYTAEGYPYYVHRETGTSQWENPTVPPPPSPASVMTPDAIIRMRLAEARSQKPTAFALHGVSVVEGTLELATAPVEQPSSPLHGAHQSQREQLPTPSTLPPAQTSPDTRVVVLNKPNSASSSTEMTTPTLTPASKYQSRTGFELSIDVASPTRKDGTESG